MIAVIFLLAVASFNGAIAATFPNKVAIHDSKLTPKEAPIILHSSQIHPFENFILGSEHFVSRVSNVAQPQDRDIIAYLKSNQSWIEQVGLLKDPTPAFIKCIGKLANQGERTCKQWYQDAAKCIHAGEREILKNHMGAVLRHGGARGREHATKVSAWWDSRYGDTVSKELGLKGGTSAASSAPVSHTGTSGPSSVNSDPVWYKDWRYIWAIVILCLVVICAIVAFFIFMRK
jgi:hypothetical protein